MTATYEYSNRTGLVVPDTQDLLEDVQDEYRAALGSGLNVNSSTPQGALIGSETIARTHVMRNNAEMANLINPNYSYGVALDALMSLTGSERGTNISTVVRRVAIEGNSQTFIPRNSRLSTGAGAIFITSEDITIGASGSALGTIQSVEYGDIEIPISDLRIIDGVIGWNAARITSSSIVTPGSAEMSDAACRNMRMRRLFALGSSSSGAIKAAALATPNVRSVNVVEQNTGVAPAAVHGVGFSLPSAMWVCIDGSPDPQVLVNNLFRAHRGGCPWDYGNYGGSNSGTPQDPPLGTPAIDPSTGLRYYVKWTKASEVDCWVIVRAKQPVGGANPVDTIPQLIVDYANGDISGEEGFVVGAPISGFDMAGAISAQMPGLFIQSVQVAITLAGGAEPPLAQYNTIVDLPSFYVARAALGRVRVEIV